MADNFDKLWLQDTQNALSINRAQEEIQRTGRALPCSIVSVSGQIVTVNVNLNSAPFALPNLTVPIESSVYDWIPFQPGDLGWIKSADASLRQISGLGSGTPTLAGTGNLTSLVFSPIANVEWTAPGGDADKRVVQGLSGFLAQSVDGSVSALGDKSNGITLTFGQNTLVIDSSGITLTVGSYKISLDSSGITLTGASSVSGDLSVSGVVSAGNGATGSFTLSSGVVVTVANGIVTGIS